MAIASAHRAAAVVTVPALTGPSRVSGSFPAHTLRQGRVGQVGQPPGTLEFVQVHPHLRNVVQITTESKAHAGALESLRIPSGHGVLVIRPMLPSPRVTADSEDGDAAANHHLRAKQPFTVASLPLNI